jgi:hypothetical protein
VIAERRSRGCASVRAVDSTIVVGVVGVVATAVTAWIGSWNTRRATERTVEAGTDANRATLAAAREERLWERRAAAYEEMLTMLLHRRAKRNYDVQTIRMDDETPESELKKFYKEYKLPGIFETESRLVAYASDAVMAAYEATRSAHSAVQVRSIRVGTLLDQIESAQLSRGAKAAPDVDTFVAAEEQVKAALKAANAADGALINVIRSELRSRPEAAQPPSALPAVHSRLWRRA